MADYDAYDEATLQQMANDAESYEERSAIRQALRRKKKDRGENVGRSRQRGNSVYNRFAGSTAPSKQTKPKNFVVSEGEAAAQARPPSTGRGSSRGSTTPTQQRETTSSPVTRPRSPTPPPTPEQLPETRDEEPATIAEEEGEEERGRTEEEVDIEAAKEEEAPPSPPPSPQQPDEPAQPEQDQEEGVDGSERTPVAELPEQLEEQPAEEEGEQEQEREEVVEEERAASPEKEEPVVKEEQPVSGREEVDSEPKRRREEKDSSGGARFGGVTLRSRRTDSTPSQKSVDEPQNEFLNLKLRQTSRDGSGGRGRKAEPEPKVDFGVKLKTAPREKPPVASPPTHKRGGTGSESGGGAPRTLRDYQELSGRSAAKRRERDEDIEPPSLEPDELQKYLVAYVNSELSLHPPLPVKGGALFETCCNPSNLCKLVNKSVPNTVDLRALTKISSSASEDQKREALKENMTLALESARAIGCRVSDDSGDNILNRHPQTIRDFLVDLIRAKAVNLPGMDDEPSSTFTNMATLFEKLNISVGGGEEESVDVGQPEAAAAPEDVSWRDDREKVRKALESPPPKAAEKETWREKAKAEKPATSDTTELSYEERAAMRRAQRERKAKQAEESGGSTELSYEERAAQRKADRERRRREREALAK